MVLAAEVPRPAARSSHIVVAVVVDVAEVAHDTVVVAVVDKLNRLEVVAETATTSLAAKVER